MANFQNSVEYLTDAIEVHDKSDNSIHSFAASKPKTTTVAPFLPIQKAKWSTSSNAASNAENPLNAKKMPDNLKTETAAKESFSTFQKSTWQSCSAVSPNSKTSCWWNSVKMMNAPKEDSSVTEKSVWQRCMPLSPNGKTSGWWSEIKMKNAPKEDSSVTEKSVWQRCMPLSPNGKTSGWWNEIKVKTEEFILPTWKSCSTPDQVLHSKLEKHIHSHCDIDELVDFSSERYDSSGLNYPTNVNMTADEKIQIGIYDPCVKVLRSGPQYISTESLACNASFDDDNDDISVCDMSFTSKISNDFESCSLKFEEDYVDPDADYQTVKRPTDGL